MTPLFSAHIWCRMSFNNIANMLLKRANKNVPQWLIHECLNLKFPKTNVWCAFFIIFHFSTVVFLFSGVVFPSQFLLLFWCLPYVWSVKSQPIFTLYLVVCKNFESILVFLCVYLCVFLWFLLVVRVLCSNQLPIPNHYENDITKDVRTKKQGIACYIFQCFSEIFFLFFSNPDRDINTLMKIKYKYYVLWFQGIFIKNT